MTHSLNMVIGYTYRCEFSVAPFGKCDRNKYKFLATSLWIRSVCAACQCHGTVHLPLCCTKVCKGGRVQKTGSSRDLRNPAPTPLLWDNVWSNAHALARPTWVPLWEWQWTHPGNPLISTSPRTLGGRSGECRRATSRSAPVQRPVSLELRPASLELRPEGVQCPVSLEVRPGR